MSKTKKDNKIINLCEKYPDRFQSTGTYKTSKVKDFSPINTEEVNLVIAEMVTNIFYLMFEKIR